MSRWMPASMFRLLVSPLIVAVLLTASGCDRSESESAHADRNVLVLAAASTQDVMERIAKRMRERGGPEITISAAGSSALAQQILAGAPGDIYLAAHQDWADEVKRHGHATRIVPLLANDLVLVVPESNPADIHTPRDLLSDSVKRIALAGEHVPAGMYADQALKSVGLFDDLAASGRIVRGQNVRFTLAYVERGEVDAGIVYATDALAASGVTVVFTFNPADHDAVAYPLVLLNSSTARAAAATEVFEFLQSSEAASIFEEHGFRPLSGNR